jgi:hypothetical protein
LLPVFRAAAARCGLDAGSDSADFAALPRVRWVLLLGLLAPLRLSVASLAIPLLRLEVGDLAVPDFFMKSSFVDRLFAA